MPLGETCWHSLLLDYCQCLCCPAGVSWTQFTGNNQPTLTVRVSRIEVTFSSCATGKSRYAVFQSATLLGLLRVVVILLPVFLPARWGCVTVLNWRLWLFSNPDAMAGLTFAVNITFAQMKTSSILPSPLLLFSWSVASLQRFVVSVRHFWSQMKDCLLSFSLKCTWRTPSTPSVRFMWSMTPPPPPQDRLTPWLLSQRRGLHNLSLTLGHQLGLVSVLRPSIFSLLGDTGSVHLSSSGSITEGALRTLRGPPSSLLTCYSSPNFPWEVHAYF